MPRPKKPQAAQPALSPPSTQMIAGRLKLLEQWIAAERAAFDFQDFVEARRAEKKKKPRNRRLEEARAYSDKCYEEDLIRMYMRR